MTVTRSSKDHRKLNGYLILDKTTGNLIERIVTRNLAPVLERGGRARICILICVQNSRFSDQNGVSRLYIIVEIHHSGR